MAVDLDRLLDRQDQLFGDAGRVARVGQPHQQQHELVAALAADGVVLAHPRAQPTRDLLQHAVANRMAEGVVDRLEPVEVEVQQRALVAAVDLRQRLRQAVLEQQAVGQAGQWVVLRLMGQRPGLRLRLGDVAQQQHAAVDHPEAVVGGRRRLRHHRTAVAGQRQPAVGSAHQRAASAQHLAQCGIHRQAVLGIAQWKQLVQRASHRIGRAQPQQTAGGGVEERDALLQVAGDQRIGQRVDCAFRAAARGRLQALGLARGSQVA